jgi:hypothetical protein
MHKSSPWTLREEEGLSGDLTGRSSRRQGNGCSRAARSGSNNDLSSSESKFLRKRNPKEGGESMRQWIMRLPTHFIGRRREGRWYRGWEMVDSKLSYSMLPFSGEERKGQHPFQKGKGACEAAPGSHAGGVCRMQRSGGLWQRPAARVRWRLDWPEVRGNQSGQLGRKAVWAGYSCGDQTGSKIEWARKERFLGRKKTVKKIWTVEV